MSVDPNHRYRRYYKHLTRHSGPLAISVACKHCDWHQSSRERGFGPASKLQAAGIAHIKAAHPEVLQPDAAG